MYRFLILAGLHVSVQIENLIKTGNSSTGQGLYNKECTDTWYQLASVNFQVPKLIMHQSLHASSSMTSSQCFLISFMLINFDIDSLQRIVRNTTFVLHYVNGDRYWAQRKWLRSKCVTRCMHVICSPTTKFSPLLRWCRPLRERVVHFLVE